MKQLKKMTWDNAWENYIKFGQEKEPVVFDSHGRVLQTAMPDASILGILNLMYQMKNSGMSVYDAFLKAVEIKASSYTENLSNGVRSRLIKCKKQEIKNIKMGVYDEELTDYTLALYCGYMEWKKKPYTPYNQTQGKLK